MCRSTATTGLLISISRYRGSHELSGRIANPAYTDRFSSTCTLPVICAFTSTEAEFTRPLGVFQTGTAHSNHGRDLSVPRISGSFVCMRHHLLRYTEPRLQLLSNTSSPNVYPFCGYLPSGYVSGLNPSTCSRGILESLVVNFLGYIVRNIVLRDVLLLFYLNVLGTVGFKMSHLFVVGYSYIHLEILQ